MSRDSLKLRYREKVQPNLLLFLLLLKEPVLLLFTKSSTGSHKLSLFTPLTIINVFLIKFYVAKP